MESRIRLAVSAAPRVASPAFGGGPPEPSGLDRKAAPRHHIARMIARFASFYLSLVWIATLPSGCKPANSAPPKRPPTQVIAIPAATLPVFESISLVGSLVPNEMVDVKSEIEGTVEAVGFQEGQPVEKGSLLVKLDETKLSASLAEAEANFKLSRTTFTRNEELLRGKLISQQEFDQAAAQFYQNEATVELRRRLLKDARILAPFNGIAGARLISPGQVISRNTPLTSLVDLDPIKVELNVPERFMGKLQTGQAIAVRVAAFPGREFRGAVFYVSPYVDPSTRTALVKASIPNPSHQLKPGMFANLDLTLEARAQAVVIPESAIAQTLDHDRATIFVVGASQIAQIRPVQLGVRMPGQVEIKHGVSAREMVIVEGVQKIGPGSPVVLAPEKDAAPYLPKPNASPEG